MQPTAKMRSSAARQQTMIFSISSGHSAAGKRAEIRQRIARIWKGHVYTATLSAPCRLHVIVCVEAGDVNLAAQSDRKLIGLADDRYDGAGWQRLAVLQDDAEDGASGTFHREGQQHSAAQVRCRIELQGAD